MRKSDFIPAVIIGTSLVLWTAVGNALDAPRPADPDRGRHLIEAAHTLEKSGQQNDALADYTAAIESRTLGREEQARALFDRGLLLDGMNRLDDGLQDYSAALTFMPKFAAALNNRANVYRRLRRFKEAERDYRASLAAGNAQDQYPYYGLGEIAEAQGQNSQARAFYAKALAVAPDFILASQKLAALDAAPIHLRPPTETNVAQAQAPAKPVVLHPPKLLHLRPTPAAYDRDGPALKPSLDQGGRYGAPQVQLGAWRTEAEATQGWNRAVRMAGGVLEGFSPRIVAVDLPAAGRYYRLRVVADKSGPKALCTALQAKGLDCIPARD